MLKETERRFYDKRKVVPLWGQPFDDALWTVAMFEMRWDEAKAREMLQLIWRAERPQVFL